MKHTSLILGLQAILRGAGRNHTWNSLNAPECTFPPALNSPLPDAPPLLRAILSVVLCHTRGLKEQCRGQFEEELRPVNTQVPLIAFQSFYSLLLCGEPSS